jgi:hypothetical protein
MTRAECMAMLAIAGQCYEKPLTVELVDAWASMLVDVTAEEGAAALRAHIATSPHWPKVADIRNRVAEVRCPSANPAEAWGEVYRAIGRCGRDREPQWSTPAVKAAVDAIGWRAICDSNTDDVNTLRAQFERFLLAGVRASQREANVGALEAVRSAGALPARDVVKNLLAGLPGASPVKPGGGAA